MCVSAARSQFTRQRLCAATTKSARPAIARPASLNSTRPMERRFHRLRTTVCNSKPLVAAHCSLLAARCLPATVARPPLAARRCQSGATLASERRPLRQPTRTRRRLCAPPAWPAACPRRRPTSATATAAPPPQHHRDEPSRRARRPPRTQLRPPLAKRWRPLVEAASSCHCLALPLLSRRRLAALFLRQLDRELGPPNWQAGRLASLRAGQFADNCEQLRGSARFVRFVQCSANVAPSCWSQRSQRNGDCELAHTVWRAARRAGEVAAAHSPREMLGWQLRVALADGKTERKTSPKEAGGKGGGAEKRKQRESRAKAERKKTTQVEPNPLPVTQRHD